jgi:hypothetical protein
MEENKVTETQNIEGQENNTPKTYTEEEVQALLQREGDRRVTEALKKAEKKNEQRVREAQKLAQMNEQEQYEYQLKQREEAIAAKERELALMENKNEASKILADKGLSLALVDFIVAEDADTMAANIKTLEEAFKASVKAEVEKRMTGSTPKKSVAVKKQMTQDEFAKLSYAEMLELKQSDPELYRRLAQI